MRGEQNITILCNRTAGTGVDVCLETSEDTHSFHHNLDPAPVLLPFAVQAKLFPERNRTSPCRSKSPSLQFGGFDGNVKLSVFEVPNAKHTLVGHSQLRNENSPKRLCKNRTGTFGTKLGMAVDLLYCPINGYSWHRQ